MQYIIRFRFAGESLLVCRSFTDESLAREYHAALCRAQERDYESIVFAVEWSGVQSSLRRLYWQKSRSLPESPDFWAV